jgi:glycine/D-amino acid oxidase-like deaminating enzyme
MLKGKPRVAVLGAGIMGCCTALQLARRGCAVTLIDKASAQMAAASRWNEGKIHLGFLYAADSSGLTADKMLPGGLAFRALVEELIEEPIDEAVTRESDIYLVHPNSVVDAESMGRYFRMLDQRLAGQAGYLAPLIHIESLTKAELDVLAGGVATAGFRVPERSVNTLWLADRLAAAVNAEPQIASAMGTVVHGASPVSASWNGPWRVECQPPVEGQFDIVINALWDGRIAMDVSSGFQTEGERSHRYRLALFVHTTRPVNVPSVVVATGPFGDIKNYDGRHFYLSWYPAGLVASGDGFEPPAVPSYSSADVQASTVRGLAHLLPAVSEIVEAAMRIDVAGGWVFAAASGSLGDAHATLHRRDKFGSQRRGTYYSVDTGKYSTAPWLAKRIADEIFDKAW